MLTCLSIALLAIAVLVGVPIIILFVETGAALSGIRERDEIDSVPASYPVDHARLAVLVPAHNESSGLLPTLEDIKPQLKPRDRLIVIADNCSDDTAAVAAAAGAEVIVRNDPTKTGKGFALDWAVRSLAGNPPDYVVFIDADCRIQADMIDRLRTASSFLKKPVQACFLMKSPTKAQSDFSISEFAWIIRNWIRPLGLRSLHCPVQLMGTGMIIPWQVFDKISLASGHLVEDLKFGLDLAAINMAPQFYPFVVGTSYFPTTVNAAKTQRQRWVTGHVAILMKSLPIYLVSAIRHRNRDLLVLCLDMVVPPLSLLVLSSCLIFVLSAIGSFFGLSPAPLIISTMNMFVFGFTLMIAWLRFGRDTLAVRNLWRLFPDLASRLKVFGQILTGKTEKKWIRTDRAGLN